MNPRVQLPKNHPFLLVGQEIDQLLNPLKRYGVTTLTFIRNYDSGHQVLLSNNTSWVEDYYSLNLCGNFISGHPKKYTQKSLIIPNESPLMVHKIAREKYNEGNTFCLIDRQNNYTEFFFFAGRVADTALTNFFINNIDLFETFRVYFKSSAEELIKRGIENKVLLSTAIYAQETSELVNSKIEPNILKDTLRDMKIKNFKLNNENIKLTEREIDCIACFQRDLTAKETAIALNLSYRTIEKYFDALNQKLNLNDKKAAVKYVTQHGFPDKILTYATYHHRVNDQVLED